MHPRDMNDEIKKIPSHIVPKLHSSVEIEHPDKASHPKGAGISKSVIKTRSGRPLSPKKIDYLAERREIRQKDPAKPGDIASIRIQQVM